MESCVQNLRKESNHLHPQPQRGQVVASVSLTFVVLNELLGGAGGSHGLQWVFDTAVLRTMIPWQHPST